ncbi:MAG: peroxiredoxin [Hyphomicrobiaceae bacterium]
MTAPEPSPVDDGGARHLVRGRVMPDIELLSTGADPVSFRRLDGWTILFVYPWTGRPGMDNPPGWDDIPVAHGSTPEAEGFRNLYRTFVEVGARVYGLSGQTTNWQREFAGRLELPFDLVSDADRQFQQALSLPTFETGGATYLKRLTVAIKDGRIERTFYPVHPPGAHSRDVLVWLNELVSRKSR